MMDEHVAWERQLREGPKAFHAFCHHRDLGTGRSVVKAWREHQTQCLHAEPAPRRRSPKRWEVWCTTWAWRQRAEAWDADVERQVRIKCAKELVDAKTLHLRIVRSNLQVAVVNSRIALEVLSDPTQIAKLVQEARGSSARLLDHLDRVTRNAHATVQLVECERLILGLATQIVDVDVEDRRADSFANRIAANPKATALAIALLDEVAGTGPGTPPAGVGL